MPGEKGQVSLKELKLFVVRVKYPYRAPHIAELRWKSAGIVDLICEIENSD